QQPMQGSVAIPGLSMPSLATGTSPVESPITTSQVSSAGIQSTPDIVIDSAQAPFSQQQQQQHRPLPFVLSPTTSFAGLQNLDKQHLPQTAERAMSNVAERPTKKRIPNGITLFADFSVV